MLVVKQNDKHTDLGQRVHDFESQRGARPTSACAYRLKPISCL